LNLRELGWNDFFEQGFALFAKEGLSAARVGVQHRGAYLVCWEHGELAAEVSGRFRHDAAMPSDFPVVGDWVAIEVHPDEGKAVIHAVLPRRTKFSRTAAGDVTEEQVVAANIDEVFIVAALGDELNLRRIERYLALAWESRANPAVVLSKADLCSDVALAVERAQFVAGDVPVLTISNMSGEGMAALRSLLREGRTAVLLGPSGMGKSTLTNHLCGEELQDIQPVRDGDHKGRHTTTRRELILLPSGGCIIDTPGLRELQMWDGEAGLVEAFADIAELAAACRFNDCRHESEPGCAVLEAVESGLLDAARLESHRKLQRELAYFERRHDARAQSEQRRQSKSIALSLRAHKKPGD
jgi:ribosome biogenesis GTPase